MRSKGEKIGIFLIALLVSQSIFASSKCNGMASKDFRITNESVLAALKAGCKNIGENPGFKAWFSNAESALFVSDRYSKYVEEEILPKLKKEKVLKGDDFDSLGFGNGFTKNAAEAYCPSNKTALTCNAELSPAKVEGDIIEVASNHEKDSSGKSEKIETNPCEQKPVNEASCEADLKKKMNGTSDVHTWQSTESILASFWRLQQIAEGYAIFRYTGSDHVESMPLTFLVAVRQSTIKASLSPDVSLETTVSCLKFIKDKTAKNAQGFDVKLKVYDAVNCSK